MYTLDRATLPTLQETPKLKPFGKATTISTLKSLNKVRIALAWKSS